MNNYKVIIRNTLSLYLRMIVLTVISLYTVRVVLNMLGASDYGLYNVVGGIVSMFSFMSGTLTNASQRYFAYYLADDDWNNVSKFFSINIIIYTVIIIGVFIICETVGLWFLLNKMVIDTGRVTAALWVYQFSIISFALALLSAPYQAFLVADENLGVYASISVLEGFLKLTVVYLLNVFSGDKLIIYAALLLASRFIINSIYFIYVKRTYKHLRLFFVRDRNSFKEVISYINWNFIGSFAAIGKAQGTNIIMNLFFNSVVNAARGIAYQISSTVSQFADGFMKAISPQITKAYALEKNERMFKTMVMGSKISFFLLYVVALPLSLNIDYVLLKWLKEVPEYTSVFAVLVLVDIMVDSMSTPIMTAIQATGNVRNYQIVVGGLCLTNLPLSYLTLKITRTPIAPFIIAILVSVTALSARIIMANKQLEMSAAKYVRAVIIPVAFVVSVSLPILYISVPKASSFLGLLRNSVISFAVTVFAILLLGLEREEKSFLRQTVKGLIKVGQ